MGPNAAIPFGDGVVVVVSVLVILLDVVCQVRESVTYRNTRPGRVDDE